MHLSIVNGALSAAPPDDQGCGAIELDCSRRSSSAPSRRWSSRPRESTATLDEAAGLIAPAMSLLPDRINPGPDPSRPFGPPLRPDERTAVDGAFKVPSPRNAALTAPYFHNGGVATLEQVVEFYNRGGDFAETNGHDLSSDIQPLGLDATEKAALIAFLVALTDERVLYEKAPFDHPSLLVPHGGNPDAPSTTIFGANAPVLDDFLLVPAVGAAGNGVGLGTSGTPLGNFLQPLDSDPVPY